MKIGNISIVGRANVGKSTLLNAILGEKVTIVSNKPQTTRNNIIGIYNDENTQIVFVDTPGFHHPKNRLGEHMIKEANESIKDVDAVLLVVEPKEPGKTERELIERFKKIEVPVILIINKVDYYKKTDCILSIAAYSKLHDFTSIIPISAKNNDGVDLVKNEIMKLLVEGGTPLYPNDIATNQTERQMVSEFVREKLFQNLNEEVPHGIAVETMQFKNRENKPITDISVNIICEKDTHKSIIIGKDGQMLKKIATEARLDIEDLLARKVFLQCFVKVREGWRDNENLINSFDQRENE